jgi:hypothetical protein
VDGEYVNGDTITSVLALGVVGSSVSVRALCPVTGSCSSQVIEVELKRRKASTGAYMAFIDLLVQTLNCIFRCSQTSGRAEKITAPNRRNSERGIRSHSCPFELTDRSLGPAR